MDKIYVVIEFDNDDKDEYLKLWIDSPYKSMGSIMHCKDENPEHDYIINTYDLIGFYYYYKKIILNVKFRKIIL
jgi:hypothetical protein